MSKYLFVGDAHSNIFIGEHDQKSLEAISPGNMNSDAGVAWRTFHDPAPVSLSDPSPALLPCNLRFEFYRLELDPGRSLNSECPLPSPFPRPLELGSGHFLPFPLCSFPCKRVFCMASIFCTLLQDICPTVLSWGIHLFVVHLGDGAPLYLPVYGGRWCRACTHRGECMTDEREIHHCPRSRPAACYVCNSHQRGQASRVPRTAPSGRIQAENSDLF